MEKTILEMVQGGVSVDLLLLLLQLIIAAFVVLWLKGWIKSTWAWFKFKKSTMISIGTPMIVTINGATTVQGKIVSANKSNIVIANENERAVIKTTKFVSGDYDWLIQESQP